MPEKRAESRRLINAVFIPILIGTFMILSFLTEKGMSLDFHSGGIYPRRIENIGGILTFIFIHSGWSHLANNVISFIILGSFLYYFYSQIATRIMLFSYIFSGLILWFIGRESWHIGASGLIYSLAFFLFFSGIIRKHIPLIAISLVVAFIYGSMIWHIFPWQIQDPISWEGHLSGGIVGTILSFIYKNKGPQKPVKQWESEDDETNNDYLQDDFYQDENDKHDSKTF